MDALVLQDYGRMAVEAVADPVAGPEEVLVDVVATGICGSDIHGYTGETGRRKPGQIMGHETVARVAAHGTDTSGSAQVGALVAINPVIGCGHCASCLAESPQQCTERRLIGVDPSIVSLFAERAAVPAQNAVELDGLDAPYLGALVEPLAVGYHAAHRGRIDPGDKVLVIGAGPIGQAAAFGAERCGADVSVSELNERRRDVVRGLGFDVFDTTSGGRNTFDVVIDAAGSTATMRLALEGSRPGATIVLVGMNAPQLELAAYEISTQERTVTGSFCYSSAEFRDTAAWLADNQDRVGPLVDGHVTLREAPEMFHRLSAGPSDLGKVLVHLDGAVPER